MNFLNGFKTLIGVVGSVVLILAPRLGVDVVQAVGEQVYGVAQGIFGLLGVLGLIHKVEKMKAR